MLLRKRNVDIVPFIPSDLREGRFGSLFQVKRGYPPVKNASGIPNKDWALDRRLAERRKDGK